MTAPKALLLLVFLLGCIFLVEGNKVRGETKEEELPDINIHDGRIRGEKSDTHRKLFADKWVSLDGQQRGGAGAAAKGLVEFQGMRTRPPVPTPPTIPATMAPTTTPTKAPTKTPTTAPTNAPTKTPTSAPVPATPAPVPQANNNRCSAAIPIKATSQGLGNSRAIIYDGTTRGGLVPDASLRDCNTITNSAPGVWYSVQGTGSRMWASTCLPGTTFDSKLTVYSGNCGSNMDCENANDDAGGTFGACTGNLRASRTGWDSERGVTYYILVHGFGTRTGDFQLNVISYTPLNNVCADAEDINVGDTVVGTTFQADVPFGGNFNDGISLSCGGGTLLVGSGVWYRVIGTGGTLTADTCNPLTDFDTKLNVFQGSCSSRNSCIAANDNSQSPDRCSTISWPTTAGEEYYILVNGFLTANGLFELSVT